LVETNPGKTYNFSDEKDSGRILHYPHSVFVICFFPQGLRGAVLSDLQLGKRKDPGADPVDDRPFPDISQDQYEKYRI